MKSVVVAHVGGENIGVVFILEHKFKTTSHAVNAIKDAVTVWARTNYGKEAMDWISPDYFNWGDYSQYCEEIKVPGVKVTVENDNLFIVNHDECLVGSEE